MNMISKYHNQNYSLSYALSLLSIIAYRLIYELSNAGANPNITNENGNTPLHEALMRDFNDVGVNLIQVE